MYHSSGPHRGPPPICFNCSQEGHFVVNCPEPRRTGIGGTPAAQPDFSNGNFPGNQALQWSNSRHMGAPSAPVAQYPNAPPVVTRYAVPGQPPQYGNSQGSYGSPSPAPPYQSGSTPPVQSYPLPSQSPYHSQQYGASAPSYTPNPPQSYSAPPPNSQYGQGYQSSPNGQYSPLNGPQYNSAPPQQYGSSAPTQYQSPVNHYPPRSTSYSAPSPLQWNRTTPASTASPYATPSHQQVPNQKHRDSSTQRDFSETSSQQLQSQQTQHIEQAQVSESYHQTPQTAASGHSVNGTAQLSQSSPVTESYFPPKTPKSATASVVSSRASTPFGRYRSVSSPPGKQDPSTGTKSRSATADVQGSEPISLVEETASKETRDDVAKKEAEEGEYTEEDFLQEEFNWEYKKIFKEPQPTESVALSQPLSYTYNVTPVPLLDQRSTVSVSRYARKDNLKEYLRPIRSQSQWDYLKEDPAFSDTELEGPLIPLGEARSWMEKRHGIDEVPQAAEEVAEYAAATAPGEVSESGRKRAWSNEQEDIDIQIQLEASIEQNEPPSKRQKNGQLEDTVVTTKGTLVPGTPTLGRSGTPTFGIFDDDAWAPEPGEAASTPLDPTEALLASLGVSGAPKPVREQSDQPMGGEDIHRAPAFGSMPHSISPQAHPSENNNPRNTLNSVIAPQERPPPSNGYGNSQYNVPQQGDPLNGNAYGPPQPDVPYNSQGIPVYNSGIPPQPTPTPPHGPSQQHGVPYGNQAPLQRNPSYGNTQYGPPQGQYPQHYGPPQPQYPPQGQYGPAQPQYSSSQNQYPPQGQYGHPQNQYGQPYNDPPQYNGPPQNQYGQPQSVYVPPQIQYNGPSQGHYGQPHGQWGPPQGQYNKGYPPNQAPGPQYGNTGYGLPQGPPVQSNDDYGNIPQYGTPQSFNNQSQGTQPPRQDSGYVSTRGSYSNDSGANGLLNGGTIQQTQGQQQMNGTNKVPKVRVDGGNDTPSPTELTSKRKEPEAILEHESPKPNESIESPLSPTSAEILGKLTQPSKPRKIIRVISGKNKDVSRQAEGESPTRKPKRPAPIVAEAYSRRW